MDRKKVIASDPTNEWMGIQFEEGSLMHKTESKSAQFSPTKPHCDFKKVASAKLKKWKGWATYPWIFGKERACHPFHRSKSWQTKNSHMLSDC